MGYSTKAIRSGMRARGIKTDAATVARVESEVNYSRRDRALREEAAHAGLQDRKGLPDAREVNAQRAALLKRTMRGGRPV